MDYSNIKNYIITTAFCFQKTTVHIQMCNFEKAVAALEHIEMDKARSEKWKADGSTISSMQIHFVKVYPKSGNVGVYFMSEEDLRKQAEAERGVS